MSARIPLSFLAMVGVLQAEIDSGGGRASVGSMTNQSSLGSAFATGNFSVGTTSNHAELVEVLDAGAIPGADGNANGIADSWEQQYFPGQSVDPNGDADGDGVSNLLEYLAGTNPTLRSSAFKPIGTQAHPILTSKVAFGLLPITSTSCLLNVYDSSTTAPLWVAITPNTGK